MNPQGAHYHAYGIETLSLRMERMSRTAMRSPLGRRPCCGEALYLCGFAVLVPTAPDRLVCPKGAGAFVHIALKVRIRELHQVSSKQLGVFSMWPTLAHYAVAVVIHSASTNPHRPVERSAEVAAGPPRMGCVCRLGSRTADGPDRRFWIRR